MQLLSRHVHSQISVLSQPQPALWPFLPLLWESLPCASQVPEGRALPSSSLTLACRGHLLAPPLLSLG